MDNYFEMLVIFTQGSSINNKLIACVIDNTLKTENEYALVRLSGQSIDCRESLIGAHSQCVASR